MRLSPHHHLAGLLCLMLVAIFGRGLSASADSEPSTDAAISIADQRADLDLMWRAITAAHVGLDRYETKEQVEARYRTLRDSLAEPLAPLDFFAKLVSFNAGLNSGHLYTIAEGGLAESVRDQPRLPLFVKLVQGRLYVWHDVSNGNALGRGAEILSINGRSSADVLAKILPNVSSDGFIETRKAHLVNRHNRPTYQGFDLYFMLFVDRSERFSVRYRQPGAAAPKTADLKGIPISAKMDRLKAALAEDRPFDPPAMSYSLSADNKVATLHLARAWLKEGEAPLAELLADMFAEMKANAVEALVIDVRGNNGGDDRLTPDVFAYLTDKPFRYYRGLFRNNIDVTPFESVLHASWGTRSLTQKPEWYAQDAEGRYWELLDDAYRLLYPFDNQPDPFLGPVYVLADGGSFSAGGQLAAVLLDARRALLIGEETGGDYAGPDGGQALPIVLPHSGIHVRIPLIRSLNTVQPWPKGRGALPHCTVTPGIEDLLAGRDVHMALAEQLIAAGITVETVFSVDVPIDLPKACQRP